MYSYSSSTGERTIFVISKNNSILKLLSSYLKVCKIRFLFVISLKQTNRSVQKDSQSVLRGLR